MEDVKKWRPWEDLAKFGYKPEIKYISLIKLHDVWLHDENQTKHTNLMIFTIFFFSLLATENLQNQLFQIFKFFISLFGEISSAKNKCYGKLSHVYNVMKIDLQLHKVEKLLVKLYFKEQSKTQFQLGHLVALLY